MCRWDLYLMASWVGILCVIVWAVLRRTHESIHLWYDLCTAATDWDDWGGEGYAKGKWNGSWILVLVPPVRRPIWKHPSLTRDRCFQQLQDSPLRWAIFIDGFGRSRSDYCLAARRTAPGLKPQASYGLMNLITFYLRCRLHSSKICRARISCRKV